MKQEVMQFFYTTEDNVTARVRTWKDADGAVWFMAKDVCAVLEIVNHLDAVSRLDDDEVMEGVAITDPLGKNPQQATFINESGLYALVFKSRKPEAKRFRKWVTSEVLPRLRETGRYVIEDKEQETRAIVPQVLEAAVEQYPLRPNKSVPVGVIKASKIIFRKLRLEEEEQALALDKVVQYYTGKSPLEMAGIRIRKVKYGDFEYYSYPKKHYHVEHNLCPE